MADINSSESGRNPGGKTRSKKLSTRIDMTPMVDLAFLLLTFFILTSTFRNDYVMKVEMPERNTTDPPRINENDVLSLVLAENNEVYWWLGLETSARRTDYSSNGLRKLLFERGNANTKLMVLIKPKDESNYQNIVDALDEMEITGMTRYAIVDFTDDDAMRLK